MKYLDWDTHFFNKLSFKIDMSKSKLIPSKFMIDELSANFQNSFISVKLDTSYNHKYCIFFQKCGFEYIDTEVTLVMKKNPKIKLNNKILIKSLNNNTNLPYKELGCSFSLTRFHTDLNITNDKADLLWIEYLKNFIPNKNKFLYTAKIDGKIAGVVLIDLFEKIANISYIAVIDSYRNRGVGSALIQKIISDFKGFEIKTETQVKNINALNFYIKNVFMIEKTSSIFHRWG